MASGGVSTLRTQQVPSLNKGLFICMGYGKEGLGVYFAEKLLFDACVELCYFPWKRKGTKGVYIIL